MAPRLTGLALALVLMAPGAPAQAGEPMETVRGSMDRALKVLENPGLMGAPHTAERHRQLSAIARDAFDFEEMSRRALGAHWRERTAEERQTFVRLFTELLETTYFAKIDTYSSASTVRYGAESIQGDEATVRTTVASTKGPEISIDYRLLRKEARWLIYDVDFGGITLVSNYRAQFNQIIRSSSFDALVQRLDKKTTADSKPNGSGI